MRPGVLDSFVAAAARGDLARAALSLARIEYPSLEIELYLARLDDMGREVRARLDLLEDSQAVSPLDRATLLAEYLFSERAMTGNRLAYHDPRNSCLNQVLDRGLGIPITLGVVYMEVARRAGLIAEGINFPGHFLVRCPGNDEAPDLDDPIVIDPFSEGTVLDEAGCRELLEAVAGDEAVFEPHLLSPARPRDILSRMLANLKRSYVAMHSFPQARDVTDLLLALQPNARLELRDRGLLSYQLRQFPSALRDLEAFLRLTDAPADGEEGDEDLTQVREYVKALRKRVADLN
jgi:regulator of sirC expression with transglutaminase-like and TPR domain